MPKRDPWANSGFQRPLPTAEQAELVARPT